MDLEKRHPVLCPPYSVDSFRRAAGLGFRPAMVFCSGCKARLIASLSSQKLIADGVGRACCGRCVPSTVNAAGLTADAVGELNQADRIEAQRN